MDVGDQGHHRALGAWGQPPRKGGSQGHLVFYPIFTLGYPTFKVLPSALERTCLLLRGARSSQQTPVQAESWPKTLTGRKVVSRPGTDREA